MISISLVTLFFGMMFAKHFVVDFVCQPYQMAIDKGYLNRLGGYLHAGYHTLASFLVFVIFFTFSWKILLLLAVIEFVSHYMIDFAKMNINRTKGWKCNTHSEFWILTGIDQYLHYMTYLVMFVLAFS